MKEATLVAEGSPTVRRRELGTLLRELRERNGLSVRQVTEHLLCSPSKVSRIETGQRTATLRDVRDLCDLYGVESQADRDRLMTLARDAREPGWWESYDLHESYKKYIGLEAEAHSIKDYNSGVIPGLLQTADYARALLEQPVPEEPSMAPLTHEAIEQRIAVRLRRQDLISHSRVLRSLWFIIDESVLHRVVGSPAVMHKQLSRIIDLSRTPKINLQVFPYSAGAHPGLNSTFNILEFSGGMTDVVYIETLTDATYVERQGEVAKYQEVFKRISKMAMTRQQSVELVSGIRSSYGR